MSKPHVAPNGDIIFTKRQIDWWRREKAEKARRDHIAIMNYAVSQGEARGRAKVAAAMLQQGMKPETVATISGLPLATIQKLANK